MSPQTAPATPRLGYIDWMRGLAIVIMIEAHVLDAWTLTADRQTRGFGWSVVLAGFAAPMFLFLAGVSVSLAAASAERRSGSAGRAAAGVRRRGWEIWGLAYLFRLQAYLLNSKAALAGLLKVDILNIMGLSIIAAAALWQFARSHGRRLAVFAGAALAITLLTPLVRSSVWIDGLPSVVQWYLRATPGKNNFQIFPWAGFVFAGALVGVLLDRARDRAARLHAWMAPCGLVFAAACYAGSYLPSIYADSFFWTTSPMFFLLRVGILCATLSLAYHYTRLIGPWWPWPSPMAVFGRSSLFVYWIHVELVYGIFSARLHKRLPFGEALAALGAFTLVMFGLVLAKNHAVGRWRAWRVRAAADRAPVMVEKA